MVFKSKLYDVYGKANPKDWLTGDWKSVDPLFAQRLANFAKAKNQKMKLNETYRSTELQRMYYNEYLQYKKTGRVGVHGIKLAAKPGTSSHEFRLAIDVDKSHPLFYAKNDELKIYGLCKPVKSETWHIQPIETNTTNSSVFKKFEPINLSIQVQNKFRLSDGTMKYLEDYKYSQALFEKLLNGVKSFSEDTVEYLARYEYWDVLKIKLGIY